MFDLPITAEIKVFEERFSSETELLLILTGPIGFGGGKSPSNRYWTASMTIVAWRSSSGKLEQERGCLFAKVDDDGLTQLQNTVPGNCVIQATVRRSKDGTSDFLLTEIPSLSTDKELNIILAEQLKPVYYDDSVLGRFTLDRSINCFDCAVNWLEKPVTISFDDDDNEIILNALKTAHALFAEQEYWNRRVLAKASNDLLDLKNDSWLDDDEEEMTTVEFESRVELDSIEVRPNGEFCFWFNDGDIFWGHSITVEGTLSEGPIEANMQG